MVLGLMGATGRCRGGLGFRPRDSDSTVRGQGSDTK